MHSTAIRRILVKADLHHRRKKGVIGAKCPYPCKTPPRARSVQSLMTPDTVAFRYGCGLPLPAAAPLTAAAMLAGLSTADDMAGRYPGPGLDAILPVMAASDDLLKVFRRTDDPARARTARAAYRADLARLQAMAQQAARTTIARALDAPDGLRERLAWFWADHFTTVPRARREAALPAALLQEAIRPNLSGPFATLATAAITHPAMLIYLDQTRSFGPNSRLGQRRGKGLNENLAREVLELHTLGAGAAYSQFDVRQMAELLTGLTLGKTGFQFDKRRTEPGAETVLGVDYSGDTLEAVHQVLADLARHPATATHIARKLAVHFVSDTPPPAVLAALSQAWVETGGDLLTVYAALLAHAGDTPRAAKARQPIDFIVAALRALGVTGADVMALEDRIFRRLVLQPMADMGQPWQAAPGPDGWPEDAQAWITPQGMAARITWAMGAPQKLIRPLPDPMAMLQRALGPRASSALRWAVPRSESQAQAIGLVLASAEFNRR